MSKQYQTYTLEELATDPDFRAWVLDPSPENQAFWKDFLNTYPEKLIHIEEARELVQGIQRYFDKQPTDPEQLQKNFEEVRQRAEQEKLGQTEAQVVPFRPYRTLAIAASIVLLLGTVVWLWLSQVNQYQTYATAYGEWQTIILPDSSTVRLNANSELKIPKDWEAGKDRQVWLSGEAFFDVEKKPSTRAKFTVLTNGVSVEVLGTAFNVHSRGEKTEVFLEEGSIQWAAEGENSLMVPGDFIAYSTASRQIIETRKNVNQLHSSWKDGVLMMEEATTEEIFSRIEEIYGVEFQLTDPSILGTRTTVRIPMDKLEIALPILEKTLGKTIKQEQNKLYVQ